MLQTRVTASGHLTEAVLSVRHDAIPGCSPPSRTVETRAAPVLHTLWPDALPANRL